jgi:protein-tyrosine phosphatase
MSNVISRERYVPSRKARRYALTFGALAVLCVVVILSGPNGFIQFVATCSAFTFACVAYGYGYKGPEVFLKRVDGTFGVNSYLLFWPYHLLTRTSLQMCRWLGKEEPFHEIENDLYLGCRLSQSDKKALPIAEALSVLDVTCELSEVSFLRQGQLYFCLPVLDTQAPTMGQLKEGVAFIQRRLKDGPVYVHCALGHGRSATLIAAYLLSVHPKMTVEEAIAKIAAIRPNIDLSESQVDALEHFRRDRAL